MPADRHNHDVYDDDDDRNDYDDDNYHASVVSLDDIDGGAVEEIGSSF